MILVDSSCYISWMRAGRNPIRVLQSHLLAGTLVSCPIIRVEVLRGILKPRVREQMLEFFETVPEVPLDATVVERAWRLGWELDRGGRVLPVTDLLIGACALRSHAAVVSKDPHFAGIPGLEVHTAFPTNA